MACIVNVKPVNIYYNKSECTLIIYDYVKDILTVVEDEIEIAISKRESHCTLEILNVFDIPGMDYQKAIDFVHYYVMKSLEESGYVSKRKNVFKKGKLTTYLHITWLSEEDKKIENEISQYLEKNTISSNRKNTNFRK